MAIPDVAITVQDGALGIGADLGTNVQAVVGACSSGTVSTVYSFNDIPTLKSTMGQGPLVEAAAHVLAVAGGPILCVRPASQTNGSMGSVTATQTGTATLALTGSVPLDAYQLKVLAVQGGATLVAGTATFKYSLDNGNTYSGEIAVPTGGVYVIPNTGITLTWTYASGTAFVAGDYWVAVATPPVHSLAQVQAAIAILLADPTEFFMIHVVGEPADVDTAGVAMFAGLASTAATALSTNYRPIYIQMDLPEDTDADIKTAFLSSADTRIMVAGGFERLTSQVNGSVYKRSQGWSVAARASLARPSEDLGRVRTGPCLGVVSLDRDEQKTPGLDAARFATMRTIVGKQGFYVTNGNIMAAVGSDFRLVQNRRVMDIAYKVTRATMLEFLNDSVRVTESTGLILEADALAIEGRVEARLSAELLQPRYASAVSAVVDRTVNVLSTQKLVVRIRVTPLGYAKSIEVELGFVNPALTAD